MPPRKVNLHPRKGTPDKLPPIASARQLMKLWDERDGRYAIRKSTGGNKMPLTTAEKGEIVAWRRLEAEALSDRDRSYALAVLSQWRAPAVMS